MGSLWQVKGHHSRIAKMAASNSQLKEVHPSRDPSNSTSSFLQLSVSSAKNPEIKKNSHVQLNLNTKIQGLDTALWLIM